MRIIGYIDHPELKITVFKMNNKISIKFESDLIEQTYKYRISAALENIDDVKQMITPHLIEKVLDEMKRLNDIRAESMQLLIQRIEEEEEFDEII